MVLIKFAAVFSLVALAGCGQSLFDSRGDIDAGPGGDIGEIDTGLPLEHHSPPSERLPDANPGCRAPVVRRSSCRTCDGPVAELS